MVTQQQIDAEAYAGTDVIDIDPPGGGVDVLYRVGILEVITSEPYTRRLVQWKASDDISDVVPGEGMNANVHFIGIPYCKDERFVFVECPEAGSYTLEIPSFSEVSDEVVVHRIWCAALRPTNEDFVFANPFKDIAVTASPATVNLETVALDTIKTVKSTDTVTITHTQDFPCVFGIIYKHKAKGEIAEGGVSPAPVEADKKFIFPITAHKFPAWNFFCFKGENITVTDMYVDPQATPYNNKDWLYNCVIRYNGSNVLLFGYSNAGSLQGSLLSNKFKAMYPNGFPVNGTVSVSFTTSPVLAPFNIVVKYTND